MMARCYNPNIWTFERYGGRGITVCDRWKGSDGFSNFLSDVGMRPSPKHSLDRIDNDKGYFPENCRWVKHVEQCNNRSSNRRIEIDGTTKTLAEWSREYGINQTTAAQRLKSNWCVKCAFTLPIKGDKCPHST
jgi:hypothetical protein